MLAAHFFAAFDLRRTVFRVAALALVVFFALRFTIDTVIVIGISMEPSFHTGQRILISKVTYRMHEPERGDVIVFSPVNGEDKDLIKRIIAVPNDTVEVKDNAVYVNGKRLEEPYIKNTPRYHLDELKVPADSYFVLGDNRNQSNDSHNGWMVPRQNIIGKAWLSIWPPPEWGLVPRYALQEQLASASNTYTANCCLLYI